MWRFNMLVSAILLMTDMLAVLAAGTAAGIPSSFRTSTTARLRLRFRIRVEYDVRGCE